MSDEGVTTAANPAPADAVVNEDQIAAAELLKDKANVLFKNKHFHEAIEWYTKAIEQNGTSAVYYSNRAFAHIKVEEFGSAITDATAAIQLNASYIKAYYRRADANLALGKFKAALKDFKLAAKVAPRDPDLKRKLTECEKERASNTGCGAPVEQSSNPDEPTPDEEQILVSDTVVLEDMIVEEAYAGPRMEKDASDQFKISREFVLQMIEAFKDQKKLHRRFAFQIVLEFQKMMRELPALVDIDVASDKKITVCGDTHGQFYDLLRIFELNGWPSVDNPYVFNGDFVDRGSFSVEVIMTLMAWKLVEPRCMHLTRGNHEAKSLNKIYGFEGEVKAKYNMTLMEVFRETFCALPLAFCLQSKVLVLHGGLFSRDDVTLDELRKIDRFHEPPESGLMCEMLWSDPQEEPGRAPSKRGCGLQFGPDVTKAFLERNGLELIVRSHEVKEGGYEVTHDGYLVTVFSAPNYCDNMGNKGAFITFNGSDMVPHFTTFEAAPHPDVKPMAYANMGLFGGFA